MEKQRTYVCIDMKSFYASVECAERHLSPFETNLVVADETRGKGAITLAISPKMKSLGVKNRCRLFEIPQNMDYIIAMPRMSLYIKYCADIFEIYLDYFSQDDNTLLTRRLLTLRTICRFIIFQQKILRRN